MARRRHNFTDQEIQCAKCDKWKNVSKFKKNSQNRSGYEYVCRLCGKLYERYGISARDYEDMFNQQNGICGVCPRKIELFGTQTHVDHDHSCCNEGSKSCGRCVRGLLCLMCNLGLGYFQYDIENMKKAIEYLEKHASV